MELSVAPSCAHCAAAKSFLLVLEVVLQFSVSVSHTEQILEVVTPLRGGPLHVRPAQLRNPTLFLGKALCGHVLLALQIHAPGSDRIASSSCGAPSILFTAFQRLALSFRATARWSRALFRMSVPGEPDVEPPSRRVRSGMRVLRKPLYYARGSSAQPRGGYFENEKHNVTTIHALSSVIGAVIWKNDRVIESEMREIVLAIHQNQTTENEAATRTERHKLGTHPNLPRARGDRHPLETCTRLTLGSALTDVPVEDGRSFSLSGGSQIS